MTKYFKNTPAFSPEKPVSKVCRVSGDAEGHSTSKGKFCLRGSMICGMPGWKGVEIDSDVWIDAMYRALIAGVIQATEEGFPSSRRCISALYRDKATGPATRSEQPQWQGAAR